MSARDALRVLAQLGMTASAWGHRRCRPAIPPAGEPIESASTVVLKLGRQGANQIASAAKP